MTRLLAAFLLGAACVGAIWLLAGDDGPDAPRTAKVAPAKAPAPALKGSLPPTGYATVCWLEGRSCTVAPIEIAVASLLTGGPLENVSGMEKEIGDGLRQCSLKWSSQTFLVLSKTCTTAEVENARERLGAELG